MCSIIIGIQYHNIAFARHNLTYDYDLKNYKISFKMCMWFRWKSESGKKGKVIILVVTSNALK